MRGKEFERVRERGREKERERERDRERKRIRNHGLLFISAHVLVFRSRLHKSLKGRNDEKMKWIDDVDIKSMSII